jgi:hypothetical protein
MLSLSLLRKFRREDHLTVVEDAIVIVIVIVIVVKGMNRRANEKREREIVRSK